MKHGLASMVLPILALAFFSSYAGDGAIRSPQAAGRSYAQNYKDMVLAECIARAYGNEPEATLDAGSSASALMDWTRFDLEKAPDASRSLVESYLARDYRNPLVEAEVKDVRFDLLKCLDLYHGKELDAQAKRLVMSPKRTFRQDNPPARLK